MGLGHRKRTKEEFGGTSQIAPQMTSRKKNKKKTFFPGQSTLLRNALLGEVNDESRSQDAGPNICGANALPAVEGGTQVRPATYRRHAGRRSPLLGETRTVRPQGINPPAGGHDSLPGIQTSVLAVPTQTVVQSIEKSFPSPKGKELTDERRERMSGKRKEILAKVRSSCGRQTVMTRRAEMALSGQSSGIELNGGSNSGMES